MRGHDYVDRSKRDPGAAAVNFYGTVVAGQIAAGDISNFVSISALLEAAEARLDELDVEDGEREEARGLLRLMRGAGGPAGQIATQAGAALVASLLARLTGLSPS